MKYGTGDDGSVVVRITGCEYKVTDERLKNAQSFKLTGEPSQLTSET